LKQGWWGSNSPVAGIRPGSPSCLDELNFAWSATWGQAAAPENLSPCPLSTCAVQRRRLSSGCKPHPANSLPPEAIGAVMEVTKWLKPSISVSRIGDSASVQAATRVNTVQTSKRTMCGPTWPSYRGRLIRLGERAKIYAQPPHRGSGGSMYTRKARATRETPWRDQG
jgi:hypothetical protein